MSATRVERLFPSGLTESSESPADPDKRAGVSSPGERSASSVASRIWFWVAVVSVAVATAMHGYVAWSAAGPSFAFDEVSQLQMSRLLAGEETPPMRGAGYYPGWSLLLAPIWWFTDDPGVAYRAAIWIGVVIALVTIWPLSRFVAMLGLTTAQSVAVAGVVMTMPSRTLQADYALSEKLLFLLVTCSFVVAWRLWSRPSAPVAVLFALLMSAVLFTHARMLPMVGAAIIWLLLFSLRNWRVALVGLASLGVLGYVSYRVGGDLNVALIGSFSQGEGQLEALLDSRFSLFVRVILGQVWNQTVSSFGLLLVGLLVLAVMAWRELRQWRVGPGGWLLAALTSVWLVSLISWAKDGSLFDALWPRLDAWIYGRYVEPLTALVVAVGLAAVVRGLRRLPLLVVAAAATVWFLLVQFWLAPQAWTWGAATPAHIGGVLPWHWALPTEPFPAGSWLIPTLTNDNRFWLIASLCTLAMLAVMYLARRRPALLVGLFVIVFASGTAVANQASDEFQRFEAESGQVAAAVASIRDEYGPVAVGYDRGCRRPGLFDGVSQNMNAYWLLPTIITEVRRDQQRVAEMDVDLIVGCDDGWLDGRGQGVLRYNDATNRHSVIWVAPGPIQDGLRAEGRVD